jgi:hypothetical protein
VGALFDRLFWQAHENCLWQAGRGIHLHFDRHAIDAHQRERLQLGEHGARSSMPVK